MSEMQVQDAAGEATGLSQWQRVTNTFAAPAKTFEDINRGNRSWWLPLILISVAAYLFFAVVATKIGMQQVVDNQIHMNPAQEERMAQASPEQRETGAKIALYITEGIFAATPVITLGVLALLSLGLMGTINFGFGGKAKYSSVLAVWLYSILPSLVNFAPTNLGAFLNPLETNKALYALTTSLDAVQIWSLVLLSIGIATVAGVKRSSGYIAVFGWWAIFVLFGVGMAAMMG
jgi:cell division protein FtsB